MSECVSVEISVPGGTDEEPDIDAIARELREPRGVTGLELALSIGRLMLERLYGGDIAVWHSRGRKDGSFRRLAKHPDLPFGPSTLSRAVGIYEISLRRPDLLGLRNVTWSHVRELLKLPSDQQDRLIDETSRNEWSVRRLRDEIGRVERSEPPVARRAKTPRFAKFLRTLEGQITEAVLLRDVEQAEWLAIEQTEELLRIARSLRQQSETVIAYLTGHLTALREAQGRACETQASAPVHPGRSDVAPCGLLRRRNTDIGRPHRI